MATPTTLPATFVAGTVLTAAQMNNLRGAFRVLQVVSTTKTNTFSTSSSSFTDVTGLSVTITPSAISSQILVLATYSGSCDPGVTSIFSRLLRGATAIDIGDAAGSRVQASNDVSSISVQKQSSGNIVFLDSPATTSATTYKMQVASPGSSNVTIGGSSDGTDSVGRARTPSTILVMEISA